MKKNRQVSLFVTALLVLLLAACGTPATSTPTAFVPTDVPFETETPLMPTMEMTQTETPVPTATVETATPTATGPAGTVPVELICWFCVQQVSHVVVTLPQSATFEVTASSSGVECNQVETVGDKQIVLCQGPTQASNVSFDLNVCSNGNCSERHLATVDCAGTAMPSATSTPTVTATTTGTVTVVVGAPTQTPTEGVGVPATSTATPVMAVTATPTPVSAPLTVTPTP